jgi:hypothetical protein
MTSPHWGLVITGVLLVAIGTAIWRLAPSDPPVLRSRLLVGQGWFLGGTGAKIFAMAWAVPGAVLAIIGLVL